MSVKVPYVGMCAHRRLRSARRRIGLDWYESSMGALWVAKGLTSYTYAKLYLLLGSSSKAIYSKTCHMQPLKNKTKTGFLYRLSPNAGQKYCRMLQREHSAILSTFMKLLFVFKNFVLSILSGRLRRVLPYSPISLILWDISIFSSMILWFCTYRILSETCMYMNNFSPSREQRWLRRDWAFAQPRLRPSATCIYDKYQIFSSWISIKWTINP